MLNKSAEEINNYIQTTQIKCSYKYIVFYIFVKKIEEKQIIDYNELLIYFESFFKMRENFSLQIENDSAKCNPLNNIKKTIDTPLSIFEENNIIKTNIDFNTGIKTIDVLFETNEETLDLIKTKIDEYFIDIIKDDPTNFSEFFDSWEESLESDSKFDFKSSILKYYDILKNETFILEKPVKEVKAYLKIIKNSVGKIKYIVKKDSIIDERSINDKFDYNTNPSTKVYAKIRDELEEKNILVFNPTTKNYRLIEDTEFKSLSAASQFVSGTSSNGRKDWVTIDNLPFIDYIKLIDGYGSERWILLSELTQYGSGSILPFIIDKFNGMEEDECPKGCSSHKYYLSFYEHFNLPCIENWKNRDDGKRYRFNNLFSDRKFLSAESLHDYRYRGTVYWDKIEGLDKITYRLKDNYLEVLEKEIADKKIPFGLFVKFLYYKQTFQSVDEMISLVKADFHLDEIEFDILFDITDLETKIKGDIEKKQLEEETGKGMKAKIEDHNKNHSEILFNFTNKKEFENSIKDLTFEKAKSLLLKYRQIILYGPPGTGKSYLAQILAQDISKDKYEMIQFHPSYSYNDFVEGIIAKPNTDGSGVIYEAKPKIFRKLCKYGIEHPKENIILIIDEINRGDLSQIFGELIISLEDQYRDMEIITPLSDQLSPLVVPKNLYIIGTMNSLDRSIAIVDYALRRRFMFLKIEPSDTTLRKWLVQNFNKENTNLDKITANIEIPEDLPVYALVLQLYEILNSMIKKEPGLDENYLIGHSYFFVKDYSELGDKWECMILPLLEEYFNFDESKLKKYYLESIIKNNNPIPE